MVSSPSMRSTPRCLPRSICCKSPADRVLDLWRSRTGIAIEDPTWRSLETPGKSTNSHCSHDAEASIHHLAGHTDAAIAHKTNWRGKAEENAPFRSLIVMFCNIKFLRSTSISAIITSTLSPNQSADGNSISAGIGCTVFISSKSLSCDIVPTFIASVC